MDDDESYTLRTGESLELGEGYAVTPQQIDVDGNKVWLELTKDGEYVEDKIISTDTEDDAEKIWYYEMDLNDNEDVAVIMIHIDEVFQGQVDSLCVIEGIFQISDDPLVLEEDDEFGELTITYLGEGEIVMTNDDNELDMPDDDTLELTDTIGVRANDGTTLWYIYTEATVDGEVDEPAEPVEPAEPEEPVEPTEPEEPAEPTEPTEPAEPTEPEEPEEPAGEEEEPGTPGFEAVFAVAGLLAVAYFVRRN